MKKLLLAVFSIATTFSLYAQREVPQERMEQIYEEVKTPYKYGLAVAPADNYHKIDCPTVFRQGDKWLMTYVVYNGKGGTDGRGYETWIAESDNLLEWRTLGRVLSYRDGKWDCNQRGGFPALPDMEWGGSYELQTYKGRHWMTYIGGEGTGYEAVKAPLYVGLAWTKGDISTAHEWESMDKPILSIHDKDAQWWEKLTQYKSTVYWDKDKTLGAPFVMYYNAGGRHPETDLKGERVGIALSKDMKTWKRYSGNPVFAHEADGTITGDAHIQKMGDVYVMFYFSAFEPSRKYKAFNTFAASYDLVNWTDWKGADLIIPSKNYDELFAHKSYVVKHDGVVYHFYCAVNNAEQRGIAIATSKSMGRSAVRFPVPESKNRRQIMTLNEGWKTWITEATHLKGNFMMPAKTVNIPHNWDDYYGYRQLTHGNLHGTAMYVKDFTADVKSGKRYFLRFEGVGTYATITVNGKNFGRHPIGRTTLTLDVTDELKQGVNRLEVKAEHPEMIADMPWVCGGCSSEWGFSEGSQPLGIFRPVVLEVTDEIRIEPFGVHIWNDEKAANVFVETEIKNYSKTTETVELVNKLSNADGKQVFRLVEKVTLAPGEMKVIRQQAPV
ncbi:sugar-binding domain-containing protein, partial [Bacteroides ovatus]